MCACCGRGAWACTWGASLPADVLSAQPRTALLGPYPPRRRCHTPLPALPPPTRHDPAELQEQRLFDFSPAAPLRAPDGWLAWALFGAGVAPLVVGAAATLLSAVGYDQAVAGGRGTAEGVAGMLTLDAGTYARLVATTGVHPAGRAC